MEQMTGDELAARVRGEQGYLVMGGKPDSAIGTIIDPKRHGEHNIPVVIVGMSNREEYLKQIELARTIAPDRVGVPRDWPHYYRVEAAD